MAPSRIVLVVAVRAVTLIPSRVALRDFGQAEVSQVVLSSGGAGAMTGANCGAIWAERV